MTSKIRILLVCTGNTCRSAMAEVLLKKILEDRGYDHVDVASAGVAAYDGVAASPGAQACMA